MNLLRFVALLLATVIVAQQEIRFTVNLNDRSDDTFKVSLEVNSLNSDNDIYQFAATAPGTYQTMNIGRYVKNFKAMDSNGKEIKTEKVSINQYKISDPKSVKRVAYEISETWDTPVTEDPIYLMCGSSIENDHALINGQTVFGYFKGMQVSPIHLTIQHPADWKVGTALKQNKDGSFQANNYDHIVDSPILLGRLTRAETDVEGSLVEIYTYSKTDKIVSDSLMKAMKDMLYAASKFIGGLPVDRYTFIYHFEDKTNGAWEHSFSSEYVYKEQDYTPGFGQTMTDVAAHEFFHIVTPLNIHSEIIEQFNFVEPTASEHLWLYEGTTEWASYMMQLQGKMITLDDYLKMLQQKINVEQKVFDTSYTLSQLAMNSFSEAGQKQYGNIYFRGALVAGLLDILLLDKSNGNRSYRDVIVELSKKYGQKKAFSEKTFFTDFTTMTYPEVMDFFNRYVKKAEPLPFKDYYQKIGIDYDAETHQFSQAKSLTAHQKKLQAAWMRSN
ncbi:MAG: peptidase [Calditrichaeota bacterium]|nr:peptidase [Calditrichota bacterium]